MVTKKVEAKLKKLKVLTTVGTRPEIIRLSRVIQELEKSTDHILVHTGQNYDFELNEVFFRDLGLRKPDYFLSSVGASVAETIGNIIARIDPILESEKPEAFLVLGDTNSCLAALAAKRRKIPVFHMEAGNRCFDQRVPEEINRRLVDHLSDINLPYSDIAREYLLAEGFPPDRIVKTGSPIFEVIHANLASIRKSAILRELGLSESGYFLVSCHREENVDVPANLRKFVEILNELSVSHDLPVIVSTHPRTRKKIEENGFELDHRIRLLKPFGFFEYVNLQLNAKCVLSDSGTITEESSILNFPALNIREAHERPEGMEEGAVILTGLNIQRVMQGLALLQHTTTGEGREFRGVSDYMVPNVAAKVVRIIHSYTDYVNRTVWKKY